MRASGDKPCIVRLVLESFEVILKFKVLKYLLKNFEVFVEVLRSFQSCRREELIVIKMLKLCIEEKKPSLWNNVLMRNLMKALES